jgi:hypothetical protein
VLKNLISKTGHRRARPWGGWLRAATLTAGIALGATAHADVDAGATIPGQQSGSVTVPAPTRSSTLRQTVTKQNWISHKDCVDDMQLTFNVAVSAPSPSKVLLAYVSNSVDDCLQNSTRNDPARCRHIQVVPSTPTSAAPLVILKAQTLTELLGISNCGDDAADAGLSTAPLSLKFYFLLAPPAEDLTVGTNDFAIYADSGIDLWGPEAPSDVVVTSGDEELQVSFTSGINTAGDQAGYYFFVDDGSGNAGAPTSTTSAGSTSAGATSTSVGASSGSGSSSSSSSAASSSAASSSAASSSASGAGGAGGASTGVGGAGGASTSAGSTSTAGGAGGTTSGSGAGGVVVNPASTTTTGTPLSTGVVGSGNTDACNPTGEVATCVAASSVLVPGEVPDNTGTGEALTTGSVGSVTKLKNGTAYVVAVAAYDDVGNVGKLSDLQCGTPAPVDSFLRVYRCKGGTTESGCGFCSMSGERGNSFTALVSAGLIVFGFMARRSRRPRVAGGSRGAR